MIRLFSTVIRLFSTVVFFSTVIRLFSTVVFFLAVTMRIFAWVNVADDPARARIALNLATARLFRLACFL